VKKYMNITEFRESGLLQEVNRRFFHPMGLALAVGESSDGSEVVAGIWDFRDDPEGIFFQDGIIQEAKVKRVDEMFEAKREHREAKFGYHVQPVPNESPATPSTN